MEERTQEKYLVKEELKEEQLPYLRVSESERPIKQELMEEQVDYKEKVLLSIGGIIGAYMLLSIIADWLAYPLVIVWLMKFFALAEASIPLLLSFVIRNEQHAKWMRLIGIAVFAVYLFNFLWSGFLGGL